MSNRNYDLGDFDEVRNIEMKYLRRGREPYAVELTIEIPVSIPEEKRRQMIDSTLAEMQIEYKAKREVAELGRCIVLCKTKKCVCEMTKKTIDVKKLLHKRFHTSADMNLVKSKKQELQTPLKYLAFLRDDDRCYVVTECRCFVS